MLLVACRLLPINLSVNPVPGSNILTVAQRFPISSSISTFVIRYDIKLHLLPSPLHVFYCANSYQERSNPNNALINLTQKMNIPSRRPWYGTVLVLKFANEACTSYVTMTLDDVMHIQDYFGHFA